MNYFKLKSFPLFILALLLLGCEKDDICAESTATTPQLIIRFYDNANQENTKTVSGLYAYGIDDANEIISIIGLTTIDRDSIVIPLRTDADITKIILHKEFEVENDNDTPDNPNDDTFLGNPDTITISYEREDVYVSRACGYKTVFNNISFALTTDGDNWILGSEIAPNTNITNETSAHVKIFH